MTIGYESTKSHLGTFLLEKNKLETLVKDIEHLIVVAQLPATLP